MIAIIDYGGGNTGSVKNALDYLGFQSKITSDKKEILNAQKIIFPGVGNFEDVMAQIKIRKLGDAIKDAIDKKIPFLGICVGYQTLFETSKESETIKGLGIIKGKVVKFKTIGLKIPQIGWNKIRIVKESMLMKDVPDDSFVYFVHSYYPEVSDNAIVLTKTAYGNEFASSIEKGNLFATQFHPEKSGKAGLQILKNFCEI
ncbi:MAG: imidazole glycerol phosphate synthase subunit HisH [Nanoarchaeota archaeon]|nr:imidazole glycerol phosphate synthase subunit HisH [Nanoarchaeota archaeon]